MLCEWCEKIPGLDFHQTFYKGHTTTNSNNRVLNRLHTSLVMKPARWGCNLDQIRQGLKNVDQPAKVTVLKT